MLHVDHNPRKSSVIMFKPQQPRVIRSGVERGTKESQPYHWKFLGVIKWGRPGAENMQPLSSQGGSEG
jgi:hypothetical protein